MTAILNTLSLMVMAIEISAAKWIVASTASGEALFVYFASVKLGRLSGYP